MSNCHQCQKPFYLMPQDTRVSLPSIYGAYCQCQQLNIRFTVTNHTTANSFAGLQLCSKCSRYVHPMTHTEADCERLLEQDRQFLRPKMEVPRAFYDAFSDEEVMP